MQQTIVRVRIEADDEATGRDYASAHGIDLSQTKWYPNHRSGSGGRLYATVIHTTRKGGAYGN